VRPRSILEPFVLLLSPFAPHIAEELWEKLGHTPTLAYEPWPAYDRSKLQMDTVEVVLQVNGKVRSKIAVPADLPDRDLEKLALADEAVRRHCEGKTVAKAIVVPNKLVNVVVR
jgi:leucyl-tRNA synthetase